MDQVMQARRRRFPPIRENYGSAAQYMAAVILGCYGFFLGLYAGQMVGGLLGFGG